MRTSVPFTQFCTFTLGRASAFFKEKNNYDKGNLAQFTCKGRK